jgi:hypothetical protein
MTVVTHIIFSLLVAGNVERRVGSGEDIELHFASKNPEEENGAVVFTYQSSIPAFKGEGISHPLGLQNTSAIRLLCHMLREPLFDDLRTKQQLGYIVSAYYEVGFSSRPNEQAELGPLTIPVDFLVITILSRKLAPPEVAQRIDEFLMSFRETLATMPESEIQDHAEALSTQMLKPIPKLQSEASNHFGRIQRYGPEIFYQADDSSSKGGDKPEDRLPWDSVHALARSIRSSSRTDLLDVWDRMTHPTSRSRVVSCVYGNTFPLEPPSSSSSTTTTTTASSSSTAAESSSWNTQPRTKVVNSFPHLLQLRKTLSIFDDQATPQKRQYLSWNPLVRASQSSRGGGIWTMVGLGCVLGAGVVGLTMMTRNQKKIQR